MKHLFTIALLLAIAVMYAAEPKPAELAAIRAKLERDRPAQVKQLESIVLEQKLAVRNASKLGDRTTKAEKIKAAKAALAKTESELKSTKAGKFYVPTIVPSPKSWAVGDLFKFHIASEQYFVEATDVLGDSEILCTYMVVAATLDSRGTRDIPMAKFYLRGIDSTKVLDGRRANVAGKVYRVVEKSRVGNGGSPEDAMVVEPFDMTLLDLPATSR